MWCEILHWVSNTTLILHKNEPKIFELEKLKAAWFITSYHCNETSILSTSSNEFGWTTTKSKVAIEIYNRKSSWWLLRVTLPRKIFHTPIVVHEEYKWLLWPYFWQSYLLVIVVWIFFMMPLLSVYKFHSMVFQETCW